MRRLTELDGVRALAIIAVMACHYDPFSTMLFKLPEFGWLGVDLFFVLSGLLITSILLDLRSRPHPYRVFYARRMLRIFPPYYAVMAAVLGITLLQHDTLSWLRMAGKMLFLQSFGSEWGVVKHVAHAFEAAQLPNLLTTVALPETNHGYPVAGFATSSGPTWSLSIEEWFYILWAPLVLRARRRTLGIICLAACLGALLMRWLGFAGVQTYFDFASRIDTLLFGALLALWLERRQSLPLSAQKRGDVLMFIASSACGLFLLSILLAIRPIVGYEIRESPLFMVLGLPLAGLSLAGLLGYIVVHAGSHALPLRILRFNLLVGIGTVSYTLHLIHVPVYFVVTQAFSRITGHGLLTYRSELFVSMTSAAASVLLAWVSFKWFESPILKYKDRLTRRITRGVTNSVPVERTVQAA